MRILAAFLCAGVLMAQRKPVEDAWDLLMKKQRPEAIRLLREIIKNNPSDADARLLLGSVLQEEGNRTESLAQLTEAVRLRPDSAAAQNALGEAFHSFGDNQSAREPFIRAVALDPNLADARVNLGLILVDAGEFDAAAVQLDSALEMLGRKPDAAYPHYLRAKVCSARSEVAKAANHLSEAVSLRPDFSEAWSDLGEARSTLGNDTGALTALQRAVSLAPDDAVSRTRLGAKYLELGKAHEGVVHLREAVRLEPHNQSALYNLQRALREDGQQEEAQAVKTRLAELLVEKDRAAQALLAAIQVNNQGAEMEKLGNLTGALEKYRAARSLVPEHTGIRVNFAVALLRLGRWKEGLAELGDVVRREPGNPMWQAALDDALWQAPVEFGGMGRPPKSLTSGTKY
jgi:tetratricopeptide (TPR) repeat protein